MERIFLVEKLLSNNYWRSFYRNDKEIYRKSREEIGGIYE
jgi:hypothetical protein